MQFRRGKTEDIPQVYEMIKQFNEDDVDDYGLVYDPELIKAVMSHYVDSSIVLDDNGIIVGVATGVIANYPTEDKKYFQEVLWYIKKEYRKHSLGMLKKIEDFAKELGCAALVMAHFGQTRRERLERWYLMNDYRYLETHYLKRFA